MRSRSARFAPALCSLLLGLFLGCLSVGSGEAPPARSFEARLQLPDETRERVYDVPPQSGGPVTRYALQIGELVERYASKTLAGIFPSGPPIDVEVRLEEFRFRGYQALAVLSFRVTREGQLVFERSYQGRGRRRLIQTDSAGSFELEQAVDLSTDEALRQVFGSFAREAREASGSW